jgi:hypothetical protein
VKWNWNRDTSTKEAKFASWCSNNKKEKKEKKKIVQRVAL